MDDYAKGHRQRMRDKYLEEGAGAFHDYQLLELCLFYAIPRIDVKRIAKDLLQEFGTLDNVLSATPYQLMSVDGVGENTAIFLNLIKNVNKKALLSRQEAESITGYSMAIDYFKDMFAFEENERFAVMLLDNYNKVKLCRFVGEGIVNVAEVSMRIITRYAMGCNASGMIIAHNHPRGLAIPSETDIDLTLKIRDFMKTLGVTLYDHVILGQDGAYSMRSSLKYNKYFDKGGLEEI